MNDLYLALQRLDGTSDGQGAALELKDAAFTVVSLLFQQVEEKNVEPSELKTVLKRLDAAIANVETISPEVKKLLPASAMQAAVVIVQAIVSQRSH